MLAAMGIFCVLWLALSSIMWAFSYIQLWEGYKKAIEENSMVWAKFHENYRKPEWDEKLKRWRNADGSFAKAKMTGHIV